jgi:hypothetical protein
VMYTCKGGVKASSISRPAGTWRGGRIKSRFRTDTHTLEEGDSCTDQEVRVLIQQQDSSWLHVT